ncbi:hypothetical protein HDV00_004833 [Rhizophlyctis rosea]|nr:hypothetical protein HDV00_004833 [Rhizophlyctis rosea]
MSFLHPNPPDPQPPTPLTLRTSASLLASDTHRQHIPSYPRHWSHLLLALKTHEPTLRLLSLKCMIMAHQSLLISLIEGVVVGKGSAYDFGGWGGEDLRGSSRGSADLLGGGGSGSNVGASGGGQDGNDVLAEYEFAEMGVEFMKRWGREMRGVRLDVLKTVLSEAISGEVSFGALGVGRWVGGFGLEIGAD